jgi:acyl-CoA synthetase (AMP-forming)/AMP-acid ligase II
MFGLMQERPLLVASIIQHAARHHGQTEIVSRLPDGATHRTTYAALERRARRLARVLQRLGIRPHDRVATLAWNSFRHMELYYGISGMGAVCHTVNPRLSPDDVAYILNHAADSLLFADTSFTALIEAAAPRLAGHLRAVVLLTTPEQMPPMNLPAGIEVLCHETLMETADEEFVWPDFDERTAANLCYTSGTTGRPKGVLYSHRSILLHTMAENAASVFGLRPGDRMMPVVPMFHVNGWGSAYAAPSMGAALVMPGRHLDGPSVTRLMNEERVTVSAGVPTVWLGLLAHLRTSGERLETVKRLIIGGSACPPALIEAFDREYGVTVEHAWGMTETSPLGTYNTPIDVPGEDAAAALRRKAKQGHAIFGLDMRIVDDEGHELAWDGATSGNLQVRGHWVCSAYYGDAPGSALDRDGWFTCGDVATISPDGNMEITDRSKDVIKSGGEWISSIVLENIAVAQPVVAEAAVIAAAHPKWDERPLLIVVPKGGADIDAAALLAAYRGQVPNYWIPDAVVVLDELPHSATGKISKLELRRRFRDHLLGGTVAA